MDNISKKILFHAPGFMHFFPIFHSTDLSQHDKRICPGSAAKRAYSVYINVGAYYVDFKLAHEILIDKHVGLIIKVH